jgi:hypothetical protein
MEGGGDLFNGREGKLERETSEDIKTFTPRVVNIYSA